MSPDTDINSGALAEFGVYTHLSLSFLQMCAMSGTKGSSGFGSQSNEHMDNNTEMRKKKESQLVR